MEVRQGFKRTEIGIFPLDWTVLNVSQFAEVKRGAGSQAIQYANESAGIRFIRINDFFENQPVFVRSTEDVMKFTLGERDILFAGTGNTAGASYIPPKEWYGLPHSYNAPRIRISRNVSKSYVFHAFQSHYMDAQQRAQFVGAAQPFLDTKAISGFLVAIPKSEKEQKEIATALSDVDALIAGLEKLIAKKRDLKQAAMQQLLTGQTRLPGFSGEWAVKRLWELVSLYQPTTISANEFIETGFPVYGANGIVGYYHSANHETSQVTVTCRGSTCGTVNKTVDQCWITGNAMVLNCDENKFLDKDFFYHLMLAQDMTDCITGTGQPQIVRSPLASFKVQLPVEISEQKAIAIVLNDSDREVTALELRLAKTRKLKQGMMQELLTGRTRLL